MPRRNRPNPRKIRYKLRNKYAKSLSSPKYKQRIVKNKNRYKRKKKHKMTDENEDEGEIGNLEIELIPESNKEDVSKVISFTRKGVPETSEASRLDNQQFIQEGFNALKEDIENSPKGFIAIVFDKEDNPKIIWAGDPDMIQWIGAMELAKYEMYNSVNIISEYSDGQ